MNTSPSLLMVNLGSDVDGPKLGASGLVTVGSVQNPFKKQLQNLSFGGGTSSITNLGEVKNPFKAAHSVGGSSITDLRGVKNPFVLLQNLEYTSHYSRSTRRIVDTLAFTNPFKHKKESDTTTILLI